MGGLDNPSNNVEIYDPLDNTWIYGPSTPYIRGGGMILDGTDLILIDGVAFYRLSLFSDEWETLDTMLAHERDYCFPAVKFENSNIHC